MEAVYLPDIPYLTPEQSQQLEKLYRAEFNNMLRFAAVLLSDDTLAETAVQETFLIAARKFVILSDSPSPVGWLYNTLKFVVKNMRRERQRMISRFVPLEDAPELSAVDEISTLDGDNEDIRLLKRFYIDGWSLRELAAEAGIAVPAMKMRLSRARKRAKKFLE
jgi:RNA polymerase sigma-70 factor (ECF subfamily)